ncbi:MAG: cysteine desulfurase family protein [Aerococcus sp.]|nr:cysteine desulfurase family protein [Aerococcus sp.]
MSNVETYLDYAATTPVSENVIVVMSEALKASFGNPSSSYSIGRDTHRQIEEARKHIAHSIHANPTDIIFTSCGTEANDSALIQTARRLKNKGNHIISTAAEHSSIYQTLKLLKQEGFEVTTLDFDQAGHIDLDALKQALTPKTTIVSIMAGNNEVGSLQDLQAIGDFCREHELFFQTDTVQTYMKVPLDVEQYHIDAMSLSAHKIYGPKGVGFLYYRHATRDFTPYLPGGGQENGHRAGTEAIHQILGMDEAIRWLETHQQAHHDHLIQMRNLFLDQAEKQGLHFEINGPQTPELPHILSVYWPGHESQEVLDFLDQQNIYISAGSACNACSISPSRVLVDMYGLKSPRVSETLRISFGWPTTAADIDRLVDALVAFDHDHPAEI